MNQVKAMLSELAGLFVEDRYFAAAIALWLTATLATLAVRIIPARVGGIALFGGLALILIVSVARAARPRRS